MAKTFDRNEPVVVVIGSGAGGGTLANELAQRGIDVVCLEAGSRLQMGDIVNDNNTMFGKLSWLDKRIGTGDLNPTLPLWVCKTVGGTPSLAGNPRRQRAEKQKDPTVRVESPACRGKGQP